MRRSIPEIVVPGHRLGRHISFDERSRAFRATPPDRTKPRTHAWGRWVRPYDQGDLGSCTGNGAAGLLATRPNRIEGTLPPSEATALTIYRRATEIDDFAGTYPPDDTGSSVLAAMKACVALNLASEYRWCFGLDDVLLTLSWVGPVEVGVNWHEGMDEPDGRGRVAVSGSIRGGHAFELLGLALAQREVIAVNSWGSKWGVRGRFRIGFDDLGRLLAEDGEAAVIVPVVR